MLKNFILTSFRTFTRNKTYFGLGVLGLALALSCVISLYAIINYQSNFDTHQKNADQIYRIIGDYKLGDNEGSTPTVPHPLADGLRNELPNVQAISNIYLLSDQVNIPYGDDQIKKLRQEGIAFTQKDIFDILTFDWIAGDPSSFTQEGVYLSNSVATKFFGLTSDYHQIIGKEIILANTHTLQVKGIYEDLPRKTDFPFAMIASYEKQKGINPYYDKDAWGRLNGGTQCLIKISADSNPLQVEKNIQAAFSKHNVTEGFSLRIQSLKNIHTEAVGNYSGVTFIKAYEVISYAIAVVLAIIGAINFINLSTARAIKRSKEVGIRKVMGSLRKELMFQFLLESMIVVIFSLLVGFFLSDQILIAFETLVHFEISLSDINIVDWTLFSVIVIVLMTILSGFYPALILSGYSPLVAIKTKSANVDRQSKVPLRKLLVGVQFAFSIILIISASAIFLQMRFMQGFDMGFKSDDIISIAFPKPDFEKQKRLQLLLETEAEFQSTSLHLGSPIARTNNTDKYFNPESREEKVRFTVKGIDENYLSLFDLELLSGNNLSPNGPKDQVLVTKDAIDQLKLGDVNTALGKIIEADWGGKFKIQGVIEDFKSQSLNSNQIPAMLRYREKEFYEMGIVLSSIGKKDVGNSIKKLESVWDQVYPNLLIQYDFLDEQIKSNYQFEDIIAKSTTFYVIIALIISVLGLYGLTDYLANAKKKEIGIRKVVGAETNQILSLFLKEVSYLIGIAFIVGVASSYYFMNQWLNGFEYRISLGWEIIVGSLIAIICVALITMGYRSYKASSINPISVLKDE